MADEPTVRIPVEEFQWLQEVFENVIYPIFSDRRDQAEAFEMAPGELDRVRLEETHVSYAIEVLQARHREMLIGSEPVPSLSACEGFEKYVERFAPLSLSTNSSD
jgi:hypothetical protein